MESFKNYKPTLFLSLLIFLVSHIIYAQALTPAGTIERTTKQQLLATIPPNHDPTPTGSSQLFLTSPSGKYEVFLLRRETSLGAGGFGSDFCYLQVQDSGVSVWESECTVISNVNTCTLVFSDAGLEIFDGSLSAWDTDVPDNDQHLQTMDLMDSGDLQIRDKAGELVWKASDNPIANQNCGSIGAPGLAPAHPPFGSPIHGGKGPFGQPAANQGGQQQTQSPFGQPLVNQGGQQQTHSPFGQPLANQGGQQQTQSPFGQPLANQGGQQQTQFGSPPQQEVGFPQQPSSDSDSDSDSDDNSLASSPNQPNQPNQQNQPFGRSNQQQQQLPLLDNTPFDSGSSRMQLGLVCLIGLMGYCFGFLM